MSKVTHGHLCIRIHLCPGRSALHEAGGQQIFAAEAGRWRPWHRERTLTAGLWGPPLRQLVFRPMYLVWLCLFKDVIYLREREKKNTMRGGTEEAEEGERESQADFLLSVDLEAGVGSRNAEIMT